MISDIKEDKAELVSEKNLFRDKVLALCETAKLAPPSPPTTVKLRNIRSPNKERLHELFEYHYGKVLSVRLIFKINKKQGKKKFTGIGYIIFADKEGADKCISAGKLEYEGKEIQIEHAH